MATYRWLSRGIREFRSGRQRVRARVVKNHESHILIDLEAALGPTPTEVGVAEEITSRQRRSFSSRHDAERFMEDVAAARDAVFEGGGWREVFYCGKAGCVHVDVPIRQCDGTDAEGALRRIVQRFTGAETTVNAFTSELQALLISQGGPESAPWRQRAVKMLSSSRMLTESSVGCSVGFWSNRGKRGVLQAIHGMAGDRVRTLGYMPEFRVRFPDGSTTSFSMEEAFPVAQYDPTAGLTIASMGASAASAAERMDAMLRASEAAGYLNTQSFIQAIPIGEICGVAGCRLPVLGPGYTACGLHAGGPPMRATPHKRMPARPRPQQLDPTPPRRLLELPDDEDEGK